MKIDRKFERQGPLWLPRYEWDRSGERHARYRKRWNDRLRMAIAFVGGADSASSTTAGTLKTVTYSPTAGNTLLVFGYGAGVAVSNVTDNATGGSSAYSQLVAPISNTVEASLWGTTPGGIKSGATTITITFASSTRNTCCVVEYSGVKAYGQTARNTGSNTSPGLSINMGNLNNFVVAGLTREGTSTWSANQGTLRENQAGAGSTTPGQGVVDNTSAVTLNINCVATISVSGAWAAIGTELRGTVSFEDDSFNGGIGFIKNDFDVVVW